MKKITVPLLLLFLLLQSSAFTKPTKIIVRAKAKDAKFIGSSIGGAMVIIRDALTGGILAKGITEGGTGNTGVIMKEPRTRGERLSDEKTAKFEAVLNITEPTFVTVDVYSPFNKKQATVHAGTQLWVLPGKDITGDGIIVEIPGFIVDIIKPQTHEMFSAKNDTTLLIKANVVMMCGCPITKGGLWNADKMEVEAVINKDNRFYKNVNLHITDKPDTFEGTCDGLQKGLYEITVTAFDPESGNTGVDKTNIIVGE